MSRQLLAVLLLCTAALSCAHGPHDPATTARLEIDEAPDTPWTHLQFANDAEDLQFLIVSDRTDGHRAGVFPEALRKAELLRPEFTTRSARLVEQLAGLEVTPRLSLPDGTLLTEAGFRLLDSPGRRRRIGPGSACEDSLRSRGSSSPGLGAEFVPGDRGPAPGA